MLYKGLKKVASLFFNALNFLLAGNLPPFGGVCVIVEGENGFLVVEQHDSRVVFPGGFMRWRESPTQTLQREGQEETGLLISQGDMIGYYPHAAKNSGEMSTLTLVYRGEVIGGTLRKSIEGVPCWMTADELPGKLAPEYHIIFADYLRHRAQQGETHMRTTETHATSNTFHQP